MNDAPPPGESPSTTALERRFAGTLAAVLLGAALLLNLPALAERGWATPMFQALLWAAVVLVLRRAWPAVRGRRPREPAVRAALGTAALFAAAAYVHFGRFHGEGRVLHHHELFNYTMGSKYFRELGYDGLYYATHRALLENDPALAREIELVKNLRTNRFESASISLQRAESVDALFTAERWDEFRADVRFFQSLIGPDRWAYLLADHGYNATPAWTALGALFTRRVELSKSALAGFAALDVALIAVMLLLARWGFGSRAALLFAIFFFGNAFATFDFTGGAFLRQVWLAGLVGFAAFLRRGRPAAAGVCLAVAALDRVFPALFLLLPLAQLLKAAFARAPAAGDPRSSQQRPADVRAPLRLFAGFALALVALGGAAAAATGGLGAWRECYDNLQAHNRGIYLNQISLRTLFLVDPLEALELAGRAWDESLWLRAREARDAAALLPLAVVRAALVALLILAAAVRRRPLGALGLFAFAPFLLLYPANYYCVFLALPLLLWRDAPRLALASAAAQAFFWILQAALPSALQLEARYWLVSAGLAALFAAFLAADLARSSRGRPALRRAALATAGTGALAAAACGLIGPPAPGARRVVDLSTADVVRAQGATVANESTAAFGSAWAHDDELRADGSGGEARVALRVEAAAAGPHRLRVDYTTAPPFGGVELRVNGGAPFAPIELGFPRIALRPAVYAAVELRAGANELELRAQKPGAAPGALFALDRIAIEPAGPLSAPAQALERALGWILAHPAGAFDGGRRDVLAEIAALDRIARTAELRARCSQAIAARVERLNRAAAFRFANDELDALAAAAYAARRHGLELRAFEANAAMLQSVSAAQERSGGLRPLFLRAYLRRMSTAGQPALDLERSALLHEHDQRTLSLLLAGPLERTQQPDVARALASILADVVALTDGGAEPLPDHAAFADGGTWPGLVENGLRWARESGDLRLTADLLLLAQLAGARAGVASFGAELERLILYQEPDGSFGALERRRPNPARDGVLAAALALAASLDPALARGGG